MHPAMRPRSFTLLALSLGPFWVGALAACSGSSGSGSSAGSHAGPDAGDASVGGSRGGDAMAVDGGDSGNPSPSLPPGSNFDLSFWELDEPVGPAGDPTTISSTRLEAGYQDSYFFTDPDDGAMTFFDPEDGVPTANSSYPRSELRELNTDGSDANWAPTGTNTLSATVEVQSVPDDVCVGQIHIGSPLPDSGAAASTKPLLELFYRANGEIDVGIESTPAGDDEVDTMLATVPIGTKFSYVIELTGSPSGGATIAITIDGSTMTFPMPSGFVGLGEYFKAGDYDQSAGDAGIGATVKFYALVVSHSP